MRKNANKGIFIYLLSDLFAALLAWVCFFVFRKIGVEKISFSAIDAFTDKNFIIGIVVIPSSWVVYYYFTNTYHSLLKKSRLLEIHKTIVQTFIGSIVLFFTLMLDDIIKGYKDYYFLFFGFFMVHFTLTIFFRLFILTVVKRKVENGKWRISTLLVGTTETINKIEQDIQMAKVKLPYFISSKIIFTNEATILNATVMEEDVIIALNQSQLHTLENLIFHFLNKGKTVQILPDEVDILSGKIKTQSVFGSPLIEIPTELMSPLQKVSKRIVDVLVSFFGLLLLSPVFVFIAVKVKRTSKGSVFFTQDRIGINGEPFSIIKFRSMRVNAENGVPQLSSEHDARITPFGRIMRKYRIDELPQLWNVLKGDMSLVGPRPERKYFIDQIIQTAPQYQLLQRVKPGITSLGMVKFGYASTLQEMLQRMRYDLLYIENMTMLMDIKILIYTTMILWKGKGK
ncbi:MAG TPA: sugar transferase [Chitinophagales bacterium]|nr:sugar transferase [Chitinophagales bacterium]